MVTKRITPIPFALVVSATTHLEACAQATPAEVVRVFAPFDLDRDGRAEVLSLRTLAEAGEAKAPLVVVVVEHGLVTDDVPEARTRMVLTIEELRTRVIRFGADIAAEGHHTLVVAASVHAGPPHQDGRTVLALRRLFQRLHAVAPMVGAVLVGHFPDAQLVRTCNWRRNETLKLPDRDGRAKAFEPTTTNVRCVPEVVAHRCDVVLGDLDGDWERVYVPGPATLKSGWTVFGDTVPDAGGPCVALQEGELAVTDVFHVRDGAAIADRAAFTLHLDANDRDHECSAADRVRGNPLALPELAVSRIDARGIALRCDAESITNSFFVGGAEDAIDLPTEPRSQPVSWDLDLHRERAFLVHYFDRNHRFRTTPLPAEQRKPASLAHALGSGMSALRAADPAWREFAAPDHDLDGADLIAVMRWLQQPAVLRTMRMHSDPWGGAFGATDPEALTKALGLPWHWVKQGEQFVPSWRDNSGGRADYAFYRRLLDEKVLPNNPFLLIHTGCEALSPPHANRPYDDPEYGRFAHAESILFFTGCLAMVGRAKVFYDGPRGFAEALGEGKTFGAAWQRYFAIESETKDWREVGDDIGRKRSYLLLVDRRRLDAAAAARAVMTLAGRGRFRRA